MEQRNNSIYAKLGLSVLLLIAIFLGSIARMLYSTRENPPTIVVATPTVIPVATFTPTIVVKKVDEVKFPLPLIVVPTSTPEIFEEIVVKKEFVISNCNSWEDSFFIDNQSDSAQQPSDYTVVARKYSQRFTHSPTKVNHGYGAVMISDLDLKDGDVAQLYKGDIFINQTRCHDHGYEND